MSRMRRVVECDTDSITISAVKKSDLLIAVNKDTGRRLIIFHNDGQLYANRLVRNKWVIATPNGCLVNQAETFRDLFHNVKGYYHVYLPSFGDENGAKMTGIDDVDALNGTDF